MARGINKVFLVGNLGKDPEIRYSADGKAMASLSIATSETWKDKDSGEKKEKTEWHWLVAFGRLAEVCGEYLKKGSQIYIEGRLQTRKWQDKDGNDRYTTEIVINDLLMLGGRQGSGSGHGEHTADANAYRQASGGSSKPAATAGGDFDDDIPQDECVALRAKPIGKGDGHE